VAAAELVGLGAQIGVSQAGDVAFQAVDVIGDGTQPAHRLVLAGAEQSGQDHLGDLTRIGTLASRRGSVCAPWYAHHRL
jgi:hypothetical protein